jgi:hypothetical protein
LVGQNIEEWPLRRLNFFALPFSFLLAIVHGSFWYSLFWAAAFAGFVAHVLATRWIGNLQKESERLKHSDPLTHLSLEVQGKVPDVSARVRFIFMQSVSGVLIGVVWFLPAYGIVALFK